jgi:RecB family exonuclease
MGELIASPHPSIDSDLAELLSPSQVRCFMDCQARWWFKYGLKYPDPPTGKMVLGKAVHAALTQNFAQKLDTYEDLPTLGVRALFRDSWGIEREHTEFRDDEDPSELAACGEALVMKYMDELAPLVQPAAVEVRVEGQIAGIRVQGWIDLIDIDGQIIDIKTAARKPNRIDVDHRFQIATYAQLTPCASGRARVDTLVKTKSPSLVTHSFTVSDSDALAVHKLYPLAQQAMRSELYMPNRLSMACSRRNCCYWRQCEKELGGEVPET